MYFQFMIEDRSTEILIKHVMEKFQMKYPEKEIIYDSKSFSGIGHLKTSGNLFERKGSKLLNNLRSYLRGFDKSLRNMDHAAIVVVLDNDKRDCEDFKSELERVANETMLLTDHVFCIAVKEMEAWLLGDECAVLEAYPNARKKYLKDYEQDGICDTWEVLANMLYPGGLAGLKKKKAAGQNVVGKAKCEWADKIGKHLNFDRNISPSFQYFVRAVEIRITGT